jgi:hypothetical protein
MIFAIVLLLYSFVGRGWGEIEENARGNHKGVMLDGTKAEFATSNLCIDRLVTH